MATKAIAMPRTVKDMMAQANAVVEKIDVARAKALIANGAVKFRADAATPCHHP